MISGKFLIGSSLKRIRSHSWAGEITPYSPSWTLTFSTYAVQVGSKDIAREDLYILSRTYNVTLIFDERDKFGFYSFRQAYL